jgi:uncharacterized membrane protein (DUF2068 family)
MTTLLNEHAEIHKTHPATPRGVRFIATYKAAKAVMQLVLTCILAAGLNDARLSAVQARLVEWHSHLTAAWSNKLAVWLEANLTRSHLRIAIVALAADCLLTAIESWALFKDKPWGEWLVVIATSGLIPFEIYEIIERPRITRVLVLVVNALVVAYLARRQLVRHRGHARAKRDAEVRADAARAKQDAEAGAEAEP